MHISFSVKTNKLIERLVIILLFFASMNFMGKFFYIIFLVALCAIMINQGRITINTSAFWLFILSLCLIIEDVKTGEEISVVLKNIAFPLCYILGMCYGKGVGAKGASVERLSMLVLGTISGGCCIHVFLNMLLSFSNFNANIGRNTIDIWSDAVFSATGQAALFIICIGVVVAIFFSTYSLKYKIYAVIISILMLVYNFQLACRTPFIIFAIVMLVAIINMIKSQNVKIDKKAMILLKISFVGATCILLYSWNVFGIRDQFEMSNLYLRMIGFGTNRFEDSRMELRMHYVREIWNYPFGGSNLLNKYGYAHDLLFDTWDKAGLLAALSVMSYLVLTINRCYRVIKSSQISFECKQFYLCVYSALYLEFFMEPILYGMPWLFATFCSIDGLLTVLLCSAKETTI